MIRETSNLRILKGGNNMTEYEMNLKNCFIQEVLDCISEMRLVYDSNADFDNIIVH